jgi:hypothetical protein
MDLAKLVVAICESALKPFHPVDEIPGWSPHNEMEVVPHHTESFQYPPTLFACLKKAFFKSKVGSFAYENILKVVPPVDDVVDPILAFNPETSCHRT